MQSTKTASITEVVSVPADEVRSLLSVAAKNFVRIVDGKDGVKLVSSDVVVREDGSAEVAIVYEKGEAVEAKADDASERVDQSNKPDAPPPGSQSGIVIPSATA